VNVIEFALKNILTTIELLEEDAQEA
jgi:hypothetical protein